MQNKHIHYIGLIPALLLILTGCGSDDSSNDSSDPLRAQTFGEATLSSARRNAAPLVEFDTTYKYDYFLGVYKYTVTQGDQVVGTVKMPDDKDYDLYFYDTSGNRVAFIETEGKGEDETLSYTVGDFTTLYVVAYDPDADEDSTTEYELLMRRSSQVSEVEPNDTFETAQIISGSYITITGAVGQDLDSLDDYFSFAVTEGDTINISFDVDFIESGFGSISLYNDTDEINAVAQDADISGDSPSGSFSHTVGTGINNVIIFVQMLSSTTYSMTVDISSEAVETPDNLE